MDQVRSECVYAAPHVCWPARFRLCLPMEHLASRYGVILHDHHLRRALVTDVGRLDQRQRVDDRWAQSPHRLRRSVRAITTVGLLAAVAAGLVFSSTAVGTALVASTIAITEESNDVKPERPVSIELAHAFTTALNSHDSDALVGLFTDEDAGPTVTADRYAWQKFEIHRWAQQQAHMNIRTEAYDFRLTARGAAWHAEVYRDDWASRGVKPLSTTNSIWVHHGKVANFTSNPRDPRDAEMLWPLWRAGATPERP